MKTKTPQPDVAILEARHAALTAERDAAAERHRAAEKAATDALVAGALDAKKLGDEADRAERELRRINDALRVLDGEIPKARWTAARVQATAHLEAAPDHCAALVKAIWEAQAEAQQAAATLTEKLAAADAARRELGWAGVGVRVLSVLFELPAPVLPSAPAALSIPAAAPASSTRGPWPFSVATTVGASAEQQRARVLRELRPYVAKQRASLPAAVVQIIEAAGGVPVPEESARERELREGHEHQFDVLHEQTAHLVPELRRHAL